MGKIALLIAATAPLVPSHSPATRRKKSSSHDLAALTLTETISYFLHVLSKPVFALYLDAKSAYDLVVKEYLIQELFETGISDQGLIMIDKRLANRKTICEWSKILMGPIKDQCGVEQGGVNSSDYYKVYNNEQLRAAQESELGVNIGPVTISSIGQADDVVLVSNDIYALQGLLDLSLNYCSKYNVKLSPGKTKIQVFCTKSSELTAFYSKIVSPINVEGKIIEFVKEAEHVGTVRAVDGNLPHLLSRFSAHRKQMFAVLPVGMARRHRANPAYTLNAHQVYGTPVLLSGTATLILSKSETKIIDQKLKSTVQNLQKLYDKTPASVVYFLGGQLPGEALLHLKQLSIFGMVCRLKESVINDIAKFSLTSLNLPPSSSWFVQIRELCVKYSLPHPLILLTSPPSKFRYKAMVKSRVTEYWESYLRAEASGLLSLKYFKPEYMSLVKPHPLWLTCVSVFI